MSLLQGILALNPYYDIWDPFYVSLTGVPTPLFGKRWMKPRLLHRYPHQKPDTRNH
jgi:hypothetical protein